MGQISSQSDVACTSIDADEDCLQLLLEAWYLDDGVLAAERSAVIRALHLIEDLGPHLGLHINFYKGELFNRSGNSLFPPVVKSSLLPNLDIAEKCAMPKILLKTSNNTSTLSVPMLQLPSLG